MLWCDHIGDRCITFFTDNETLVHVINKSTSRDISLMIFVRKLVLVGLKHNILFKAKHISGSKNTLADALSRITFASNTCLMKVSVCICIGFSGFIIKPAICAKFHIAIFFHHVVCIAFSNRAQHIFRSD